MDAIQSSYTVTRGTNNTVTYDHITDEQGRPYIISSELQNPWLCFIITDDIYQHQRKKAQIYWNDLDGSHTPRFYNTKPMVGNEAWNTTQWGPMVTGDLPNVPPDMKAINPITHRRPIEESVYYDPNDPTNPYKYVRNALPTPPPNQTLPIYGRPNNGDLCGVFQPIDPAIGPQKGIYEYDLASNQWNRFWTVEDFVYNVSNLPNGISIGYTYLVIENKTVYVSGGVDDWYEYFTVNDLYDRQTDMPIRDSDEWIVLPYNLQMKFELSLQDGQNWNDFKDGNYYYSVHLIDGVSTKDKIKELCKFFDIPTTYVIQTMKLPFSQKELLEKLTNLTLTYTEPYWVVRDPNNPNVRYQVLPKDIQSLKETLTKIDLSCPLFKEDFDFEIKKYNIFNVDNFQKGGEKWLKI